MERRLPGREESVRGTEMKYFMLKSDFWSIAPKIWCIHSHDSTTCSHALCGMFSPTDQIEIVEMDTLYEVLICPQCLAKLRGKSSATPADSTQATLNDITDLFSQLMAEQEVTRTLLEKIQLALAKAKKETKK